MMKSWRRIATFLLLFLSSGIMVNSFADQSGLHYPHDGTNDISCDSCHFMDRNNPPAWMQIPLVDIDDTYKNNLCKYCHNDIIAPEVETHSSLTTSAQYHAVEGGWAIECTTCHYPHTQRQVLKYGLDSFLASGISTGLDNDSLTMAGAGWTPGLFNDSLLIPNLSQGNFIYQIRANTNDTIVVKTSLNLTKAAVGNSFAVIYGRLVRDKIYTPYSGEKVVRFFQATDSKSFADGDTTFDGVCEVCHTQTVHFRNNGKGWDNESGVEGDQQNHENLGGKAGVNCTTCHFHSNGFGHGGGGNDSGSGCGSTASCHGLQDSHPTHVEPDGMVGVDCPTCHDTSNLPLFKDGQNKAGTTACDNCHGSSGAAAVAKSFWDNEGSAAGLANSWAGKLGDADFCGSCHDATPGNTKANDSGVEAVSVMGDNETYGFVATGHGLAGGNYQRMYYQDIADSGNPAADQPCRACHDLTTSHFNDSNKRLKSGYDIDQANSNCNQCHPPGALALADPELYTGAAEYEAGAHGGRLCSDCHDLHGMVSGGFPAMAKNSARTLCLSCHYTGNPDGAPVPTAPPSGHDPGATNACSSCHNPHKPAHGGGSSGGNCITCHGHDAGTKYDADKSVPYTAGLLASQGTGTYKSHSTHTENDSDDRKGPFIYCGSCHDIENFPYFNSGTDLNNDSFIDLDETDVCDTCHSPAGSYNGVNDSLLGAKNLWATGAYTGYDLSLARDGWCAGCHDEVASVIQGVAAPNVIGNESAATNYSIGYGYYKTGHGLPSSQFYPFTDYSVPGAGMPCLECHDATMIHIDGVARTYEEQAPDGAANDYQYGYRLASVDGSPPMNIPLEHTAGVAIASFRLCFRCHDATPYINGTDYNSNFRSGTSFNAHEYHLGASVWSKCFDSDWDNDPADTGSESSCVTCHNVHGSTQLSMIRDGKLNNRAPGLPIYYYNDSVEANFATNYGSAVVPPDVGLLASTGTAFNAGSQVVCTGCHGGDFNGGYSPYLRVPNDYANFNDADEDGIKDGTDNCAIIANADQTDSDGDGLGNVCDLCPDDPFNVNDLTNDSDADGIADSCDLCPADPLDDEDSDGLCASVDTCADDPDNDIDGDGICAALKYSAPKTAGYDNCPVTSNVSQADNDGDGVGNACDNCIYVANSDQQDSDNDSIGDLCDPTSMTPDVSGGREHSIALDDNGAVWAFGDNLYGQLGNNDSPTDSVTSVQVAGLAGVQKIAAGWYHNVALKADGTVWTWGRNEQYQLGNGGNDSYSDVPVQVSNLSGIVNIAAGANHSLAVASDGSVWAWGTGSNCVLGNTTGICANSNIPVQVRIDASTFLNGIIKVGAGSYHSLAVKSDGALWGWGRYNEGQLGTNRTSVNYKMAAQIENISGVYNAYGGNNVTSVIRNDSTVWSFGLNQWGVFADGTIISSSTPVKAKIDAGTFLTGVIDMGSLAQEHAIALTSDGSVWAWGRNCTGQLGIGTSVCGPQVYAQTVLDNDDFSLSDGVAVDAGYYHSLALLSDGTIWSTGNNAEGRLGHYHGLGTLVTKTYEVVGFQAADIPDLDWTGEAGYASDGVSPDSGLEGNDFVFRITYTSVDNAAPTLIQAWVDLNDSGVFDPGEKYAMSPVDANDTLYTDGRDYTGTLALNYAGYGNLDYRFFASDGSYEATGNGAAVKKVQVISDTPVLSWTGEDNFDSDGAHPDAAAGGSEFEFRIAYTDGGNDSPTSIEVWVDANDSGVFDAGEKYVMSTVNDSDHNYTDGRLYTKLLTLAAAGDNTLNYRFYASDGGHTATGDGVSGATISTSGANATPLLSWTNEIYYAGNGVDPDTGAMGGSFMFRVRYADADNDPAAAIEVWVDQNDAGGYEGGEKYAMTAVVANDTDYTDGKLYTKTLTLNAAGDNTLNYRFYGHDGTVGASGAPTSGGTLTLVNPINVPGEQATIAAAIAAAGSGDFIMVENGTYSENLDFNGKSLTLQSENGAALTKIQGLNSGAVTVLNLDQGETVTLDGFTIDNQRTVTYGGGAYVINSSVLQVKNSTFSGNTGNTYGYGGAIYLAGGATGAVISNSTFSGNGGNKWGGAIYFAGSSGSLSIENSTFDSNPASGQSGSGGGALYLSAITSTSQLTNSSLTNNSSENGAGIYALNSALNINDSIIDSNFCTNNQDHGGGVFLKADNGGTFASTFVNSSFSHNYNVEDGGGIYAYAADNSIMSLTIKNCDISDNTTISTTNSDGGGLAASTLAGGSRNMTVSISDTTINDNNAVNGGAVFLNDLDSVRISGLTASGNSTIRHGGGVFAASVNAVVLNDSILESNVANSAGAWWYNGGGYYASSAASVLNRCLVRGNQTIGTNGAYGGGIYVDTSASLTLDNSYITGNVISQYGGGLYVSATPTTIKNCTFSYNEVRTTSNRGGAIYCNNSALTVTGAILWNDYSNGAVQELYRSGGSEAITFTDINQAGYAGSNGNINSDPVFVSDPSGGRPTLSGNFHLSNDSSPCYNTGTDTGLGVDYDGDPRPRGGGYDMGADEL